MVEKNKNQLGISLFSYVNEQIQALNSSKVFAGIMIITLNIVSRFVNIKLSKTMESYLKYTFSKYVLVFTIAWMGTRDIYTALFIAIVFSICSNFLFNEQSGFCCLSESFIERNSEMLDSPPDIPQITEQQIADAVALLSNAKKQKEANNGDSDKAK